jgi:quercetin dioxygenase-like cupin family protein
MASDSTRLETDDRSDSAERPDDTIENPVTGERVTFLKRGRDTEGEFVRLEVIAEPGAPGPPEHVHEHQEEYFSVQAGTLAGSVDGEPFRLEAGEELTVWPGTPHEWGNGGDDDLRVLIEVRPAMRFEEVLEGFYGLARDGKTDDEGLPNLLQLAVIGREYWEDNHVTSPPPLVQKAVFGVLAPIGRLLGYRAHYPEYSPLNSEWKWE